MHDTWIVDSGTKATPRLSTVTSTEIRLSYSHDLLEMSIHGLLDDYFGRGSAFNNGDGDDKVVEFVQRHKSYCSSPNTMVCSGTNVCVYFRVRYHVALNEAINPIPNNSTTFVLVDEVEDGVSQIYSEPMWLNEIRVEACRDSDESIGNWMLRFGIVTAGGWDGMAI